MIRSATARCVDVDTFRRAGIACVRHGGFVHALVISARLLRRAAKQAGRSMTDHGSFVAEGVVDADAVGAEFAAGAAIGSVDVVAQSGAGVAGLGIGRIALVVAAGLVGGATQKTALGMADHGRRGDAGVRGRRPFGEAFADDTSLVLGAAGTAMMFALAECLFVVTG